MTYNCYLLIFSVPGRLTRTVRWGAGGCGPTRWAAAWTSWTSPTTRRLRSPSPSTTAGRGHHLCRVYTHEFVSPFRHFFFALENKNGQLWHQQKLEFISMYKGGSFDFCEHSCFRQKKLYSCKLSPKWQIFAKFLSQENIIISLYIFDIPKMKKDFHLETFYLCRPFVIFCSLFYNFLFWQNIL